jgi:ribosomal protein S18 acetylase RimI-like enzyme
MKTRDIPPRYREEDAPNSEVPLFDHGFFEVRERRPRMGRGYKMIGVDGSDRMNSPRCRMIRKDDIDGVLILMDELKPNIGGSRDPSLYRALCQEALIDERVIVLVCEEQSQIIGFYLAVTDRNRWRMSFLCRHPGIVAKMIVTRAFAKLQQLLRSAQPQDTIEHDAQDISMYITPTAAGRLWGESSPHIAKLMFLGVGTRHRRKQVARGLLRSMISVLAERGIRRADAIILLHNMPSIHLVHPFGFKLHREGGHLFGTKDIDAA